MINVYRATPHGLKEISEFERDVWVKVVNPIREELEKLVQKTNVPIDLLMDALDVDETARIEVEKRSVLIVLRIPIFNENADIPFNTLPLGIILTDDLVITVCLEDVDVILDFVNGRVRNFSTENRNRFILQIFLRTALLYLKYLKAIDKRADMIEKELHKAMKNEELVKLMNLEESLVFFTTSLKSNELMMDRLQRIDVLKMGPEDKDLLEDVIIENRQAIEMATIYSNILSGMMDAFASVISNNLSVVIKFLTIVTIILMLPTLIASLYGMNIELPFQHHPYAFFITTGLSLALSVIGVLIFIKRRLF